MNKTTKIVLIVVAILLLLLAADYFWWNYLIFKDKGKSPKIPVSGNGNNGTQPENVSSIIEEMELAAADPVLANLQPVSEDEMANIRPLIIGDYTDSLDSIAAALDTEMAMQLMPIDDKKKVAAENNVVKAQRQAAAQTPTGFEFDFNSYDGNPNVFYFAPEDDEFRIDVKVGAQIEFPRLIIQPSTATPEIIYRVIGNPGGIIVDASNNAFRHIDPELSPTTVQVRLAGTDIFKTLMIVSVEE